MNHNKIFVALILFSLIILGCKTVEREMLTIDKKVYESFAVTAYSESENHKVIIKLLKEVSNHNAPLECEFTVADFIGDPGICKQASLIIDNESYNLKVSDSKSGSSMKGLSMNPYDQKYQQKPNSFDYDIEYQIDGKFKISADTRNKIKNSRSLAVKFQTYNKTIDLKFKEKVLKELKNYL